MQAHVGQRDAATLQQQSRQAVQELPFGANWMGRLKSRAAADPVYAAGRAFFESQPVWVGEDGGYGQHQVSAAQAHNHVKRHVKDYDAGYRLPPSKYWGAFAEAYYVMEEERGELARIGADAAAMSRLQKVAQFKVTGEMKETYTTLIGEYATRAKTGKLRLQQEELTIIARQEQLNILQPLIYEDAKLTKTMDDNHKISRGSGGFLSPKYAVVYSAGPKTDDPKLQTVFDPPTGAWDYATGPKKSLPKPVNRMVYVAQIAKRFNELMTDDNVYGK